MTSRLVAYLDPGSAGVIVQIVGGGVAAAVVALRLYRKRILRALHLTKKPPISSDEQPSADPAR
jgi:hypothetical protein